MRWPIRTNLLNENISFETRDVQDGEPVITVYRGNVELFVDVGGLLHWFGRRAILNKTKRTRGLRGLVVAKASNVRSERKP